MLETRGCEIQFGKPYLRTKNALCERQIRSFGTVMRILMAQEKGRKWLRVLPYAIYLMKNQVSMRTDFSPHELFFGRPGFHKEFPTPQDANPKVKEWMQKRAALASKAKELLRKIGERENPRSNRWRKPVEYQMGDMVLVHYKMLPRWKKNDLDLPYYGPFMVTDVGPSLVKVRASPRFGGEIEVGFPFLKRYTLMDEYDLDFEGFDDEMAAEEDDLNDDQDEDITSELGSTEDSEGEGQLPDMSTKEMKAKGFLQGRTYTAFEVQGWLEILGQVGGLLYGGGNLGTLHSVYLGPRERDFSILGSLQCQRTAEGAQTSGNQK